MDVDGGGWTVIQKRETASDFYKGWQEYRDGFGDAINFWIGLENIHSLTSQCFFSEMSSFYLTLVQDQRSNIIIFYYFADLSGVFVDQPRSYDCLYIKLNTRPFRNLRFSFKEDHNHFARIKLNFIIED